MPSPDSILGFNAWRDLDPGAAARLAAATDAALRHFPRLRRASLAAGSATVQVWGRGDPERRTFRAPDGALLVLAGSPVGDASPVLEGRNRGWDSVLDGLSKAARPEDFRFPWDGRAVLLKISADGSRWGLWNDWCGSLPVFHAPVGSGLVAGTLEPGVVAAAGCTPDDFFLPALVSLLVHGHYLGDWTLYQPIKVVPPDTAARWDEAGFHRKRMWTVSPSDGRWGVGWIPLVDEMFELSRKAIADVLRGRDDWILPLSGGMDSRLIAAVGAAMGAGMQAFTYGHSDSEEVFFARQVARTLRVPWRRVPIEKDFLARHTRLWFDGFGSALHAHGMYQVPFLEAIDSLPGSIVMGFTGDPLAGAQTAIMAPGGGSFNDRLLRKWAMVPPVELNSLLRFAPGDAFAAMESELAQQYAEVPGAHFQKLWMVFQWSHVFGFSYYQPMMYDYWKGVATPYVNREYARFSLSLPYLAYEDRKLQKDMFRRHYLPLAAIGGTYGPIMFRSARHRMKAALSRLIPRRWRRGPMWGGPPAGNTLDIEALRAAGRRGVWPVFEAMSALGDWLDPCAIERIYQAALAGSFPDYLKLLPIQTLAMRLAPQDLP